MVEVLPVIGGPVATGVVGAVKAAEAVRNLGQAGRTAARATVSPLEEAAGRPRGQTLESLERGAGLTVPITKGSEAYTDQK
jgi:hypothetical protein